MPSAASILDNSTSIANDWWVLAVAWHIYLLTPFVTLLAGFRWSRALSAAWLVPLVVTPLRSHCQVTPSIECAMSSDCFRSLPR